MSDLVEKVARAMAGDDDIVGHKDGPLGWMYYRKPARAGIAAVVRALRDEIDLAYSEGRASKVRGDNENVQRQWVDALINEILGAAGDEAGTHGSPELDEDARKLEAMGQDPGMTLEQLLEPAAAPAPVCEWKRAGFDWDKRWPQCDETSGPMRLSHRASIPQKCPLCFRPIKFTKESK